MFGLDSGPAFQSNAFNNTSTYQHALTRSTPEQLVVLCALSILFADNFLQYAVLFSPYGRSQRQAPSSTVFVGPHRSGLFDAPIANSKSMSTTGNIYVWGHSDPT